MTPEPITSPSCARAASTKGDWRGCWEGRTVICIASGPSLTQEDCEACRASGHPVIVSNTTFRLCPWADVLFAFDYKWWREYGKEVESVFKGARVCCSPIRSHGVQMLHHEKWFQHFHNSGASSISLAVAAGAKRVILLGFDCQKTGGKTHWHGDHPKSLGNARSIGNWPKQFKNVATYASQSLVEVLNCSRETALKCFTRVNLEEVLLEASAEEWA